MALSSEFLPRNTTATMQYLKHFHNSQSPCLLIGTIMYSLTTNQHLSAKTPSEFPPKKLIAAAIETGLRVKQPLAATHQLNECPKNTFAYNCIQLFPLQFQCSMVYFFKHEAKMEALCAVWIGMGEKKNKKERKCVAVFTFVLVLFAYVINLF